MNVLHKGYSCTRMNPCLEHFQPKPFTVQGYCEKLIFGNHYSYILLPDGKRNRYQEIKVPTSLSSTLEVLNSNKFEPCQIYQYCNILASIQLRFIILSPCVLDCQAILENVLPPLGFIYRIMNESWSTWEILGEESTICDPMWQNPPLDTLAEAPLALSLIHIWRCRRSTLCRSRWSPYH